MSRQLRAIQEILARSNERGRLRELLIDYPMIAQPVRLALDDQGVTRVERAGSRLPVARERRRAHGAVDRPLEGVAPLGHQRERDLQPLARAPDGGRLLREDLLLGALERFLALAHAGPSTTPAAISSAMRSSL